LTAKKRSRDEKASIYAGINEELRSLKADPTRELLYHGLRLQLLIRRGIKDGQLRDEMLSEMKQENECLLRELEEMRATLQHWHGP
jgi:hypothetical protein